MSLWDWSFAIHIPCVGKEETLCHLNSFYPMFLKGSHGNDILFIMID